MMKDNVTTVNIDQWAMTDPKADPADDDHQSTGKKVAPDVERHFPLKDQEKTRTFVSLILIEEK